MVDIVKGRASPTLTKQAGLIFPSRWNVRQKAAVATLCILYSVMAPLLSVLCSMRPCVRKSAVISWEDCGIYIVSVLLLYIYTAKLGSGSIQFHVLYIKAMFV